MFPLLTFSQDLKIYNESIEEIIYALIPDGYAV
jgi:hypothetical protein